MLVAGVLVSAVIVAARLYVPHDAPFTPSDDATVLERVPAGPTESRLRTLESDLSRAPNDLSVAVPLVREYLAAARRSGDARLLSYAQAALSPWWELPSPPPKALLLRASIRQTRHEFVASLADLDQLVATTPDDPQPWLTRATVLGVLARYDEAVASCAKLHGLTRTSVATICNASIDGPRGRSTEARRALTTVIADQSIDPADAIWAKSVRGELAFYAGEVRAAEIDLRDAIAADPDDVYSRGLLTDLLVDSHREQEVLDLVKDDEPNEVLLLRRAIAGHRLHASDARALQQRLQSSITALRARGDTTHQREEARFLLEVAEDAALALPVAVANWGVQHEPWDARVLLESAAAVGDRKAGAPAIAWTEQTACAWPPVVAAARKLGAR